MMSFKHRTLNLTLTLVLATPLFIALSSPVAATTLESHDNILATVQQFLEQHIRTNNSQEMHADTLDARLTLARCSTPLKAFLAPGSRLNSPRLSIGVRCSSSKPWTIYLPVNIRHYKKVAILKESLPSGHVLTKDNITFTSKNINNHVAAYFSTAQQIVGKALKTSTRSGTLLTPNHIKNQIIVYKGNKVILLAGKAGVSVKTTAIALANGGLGDIIKVKNSYSNKIIEGTIIASGTIKVNM